jgi:3-phosphoshikimate 1-carboxyvinyltransferase
MTQKVIEYFGLKVMMTGTDIVIEGGQKCNSRDITIEPDWSSAAFLYAIATMFEKVDLFFPGLCMTSWQGDVAIVDIMKQFGIATVNEATGLRILRKENIFPPQIKMNLRNHPDILPVIVSMCSVHQVPFIFEGVESLHYKESNRLAALADELKKTGIILEWDEERIYSKEYGLPVDKNARLNTYNDHRLAMSFLLLLLSFPDSELENPDSVGKSFPAFWDVLKSLGFSYSTFDH